VTRRPEVKAPFYDEHNELLTPIITCTGLCGFCSGGGWRKPPGMTDKSCVLDGFFACNWEFQAFLGFSGAFCVGAGGTRPPFALTSTSRLKDRIYSWQAFASFASALAADGGHLETLTSCGRLYKSCGLLVESVESYRAAHAIDSASPDIRRALAVVLTDLGAQPAE